MSKTRSDGLARLQNESRIPASTWRNWCTLLKMDPTEAVDVWEEICHPIMIATRKVPEIPYILQLRSQRQQLDIFEFKEEIAKVLDLIRFLYVLDDECLVKGKVKSALLKLNRKVSAKMSPAEPYTAFIDRFLIEACMMVLVAKVLKGPNVSLAGVLKPLVEGRGSIVQVMRLGKKSVGDEPYADTVRECLQEHFLDPAAKITTSPSNGEPSARHADGEATADEDDEDDEEYDEQVDDDDDDDDEAVDGEEEEDDDDDDDDDEAEDDDDEENDDDEEEDDDDEEDDDEDDDDDDDADEPVEIFLLKFKTALHSIYEFEAGVTDDDEEFPEEDKVLKGRLKATAVFDPLHASIPSMEEAQNMARRAEVERSPRKLHKAVPAPSGAGAGAGGAGGGGGGGGGAASGSVTATVAAAKAAAGSAKRPGDAAKPRPAPRKDGQVEDRVNMDKVEGVEIDATDYVDAADVTFNEFSERVHQVCAQLAGVEKADQSVWALFVDPAASVGNLSALARTLSMEGTDSFKAYAVIKMVSQYLQLKNLLSISDQILKKDRNFMIEVTQMLNYVNNANKTLQPDSRQLVPLGKTLDHAAATLVRLEALRINYKFGHEYADGYTKDSVTVYYEEALRSLTDLTDRDLLATARQQADADTMQMLKIFEAARFVDVVKSTVRDYVKELIDAGQGKSAAAVSAHTIASGLEFEDAEKTETEAIPPDFLKPSDLGEAYDAVCAHVCTVSWSYMTSVHQPEKAMDDIRALVRELMVGAATFQAEKKRHQEKPAVAFAVVSLDKVSGNGNLKDLYVRLKEDGEINFVDDYEDGSFVDLFELREYKPARLATAAKKKADAEGTEALQTGRKYLYTLGRTNKLFGDAPADIINSCVRDENGGPKVFVSF